MKQYKDFSTQIKDLDEKGRVLVAANAIGNIDSDKDISETGSFDKTLRENFNRLKWFLNHDKTQLLGVPIEGKQNGRYLEILGQLNMKKQISKDVYEDYKLYAEHGKSLEHSIGVEAIRTKDSGEVRLVQEWKMWEYSTLTSWGANSDTPMLGIKDNENLEDQIALLEVMMKKGNYSDKKFQEIEQHIKTLKSLVTAPPIGTQETQPVRDWSSLTTFINP